LVSMPCNVDICVVFCRCFFFSSRRRHTRFDCDWSSDVCSSDLDIIGYTAAGNRRPFAVYRNDLPANNWVNVRPVGRPGNRGAARSEERRVGKEWSCRWWREEYKKEERKEGSDGHGCGASERSAG